MRPTAQPPKAERFILVPRVVGRATLEVAIMAETVWKGTTGAKWGGERVRERERERGESERGKRKILVAVIGYEVERGRERRRKRGTDDGEAGEGETEGEGGERERERERERVQPSYRPTEGSRGACQGSREATTWWDRGRIARKRQKYILQAGRGGGFPSSTFRKRVTYTLHRPPGRPSTDNDRRPTAHDATTVAGARGGRESAADAATLEPERGSSD